MTAEEMTVRQVADFTWLAEWYTNQGRHDDAKCARDNARYCLQLTPSVRAQIIPPKPAQGDLF